MKYEYDILNKSMFPARSVLTRTQTRRCRQRLGQTVVYEEIPFHNFEINYSVLCFAVIFCRPSASPSFLFHSISYSCSTSDGRIV